MIFISNHICASPVYLHLFNSLNSILIFLSNKYSTFLCGCFLATRYGLESTNGPTTFLALHNAIENLPAYKQCSERFPFSVRHSCSDRYGANGVAERYLNGAFPDTVLSHLLLSVCLTYLYIYIYIYIYG